MCRDLGMYRAMSGIDVIKIHESEFRIRTLRIGVGD